MYYLGVDMGTTSLSVAVVDALTNTVVTTETLRHVADLAPDVPGAHLQDATARVSQALDCIEGYVSRFGGFSGIGVTGQMHGVLYTGETGKAVSPLYTWLDKRGDNPAAKGKSYQQLLYETTGEKVPLGYGASTHFSLVQSARVPEGATSLCTLADYLVMQLCGLSRPLLGGTLAHSVGLYDVTTQRFKKEQWAELGYPELELPTVSANGKVVGQYRGSAVTTALGDNQAGFVGSVRALESSALITLGTSGQVSCLFSEALSAPPTDLDMRPFPEGGTLLVGASLTGGKAFQLLADFLAETVYKLTGQRLTNPYAPLDFDVSRVRPPYLEVDTRFAGSRNGVQKAGAISNISLTNFDLEHLVHGFAQGVVGELHAFWQTGFSEAGATSKIDRLVGSGNLLRSNRLVRQVVEETFGLPLLVTAYAEEAAVGAAIYAVAVVHGETVQKVASRIVRNVETTEQS